MTLLKGKYERIFEVDEREVKNNEAEYEVTMKIGRSKCSETATKYCVKYTEKIQGFFSTVSGEFGMELSQSSSETWEEEITKKWTWNVKDPMAVWQLKGECKVKGEMVTFGSEKYKILKPHENPNDH